MKKLLLLSASVILLNVPAVKAQTEKSATPVAIAESFLARVGKGEIGPAYDDLLSNSLINAQPMQVEALKRQTEVGLPLYGKGLGYELYEEHKFGASLVRLVYIQRLEKHALIWVFWFYKTQASWQVNKMNFNDQLAFP